MAKKTERRDTMLQGKTAIITGGTRGIGYAVAKTFLQHGAAVSVWGSRQETVERALRSLREAFPDGKIHGLWPDLGSTEAVTQAVQQVADQFGRIDILVNNAGISQRDKLYDYKPEDFERILKLNVMGVFHCTWAVAPKMKEQGGGVILNTSSMVAKYGQPAGVGYPASKYAVNGITQSLARELGPDHIRVNAVAPGVTRTDMVAALPEELIAPIAAGIPLGRVAEPEDIANAFLFLASDMASYITGAVLPVDGAAMS